MFYTIYKITNKLDNKFYIGMHKTKNINDGYMGSGTYLKRAISKYGAENFTKEILYIFDNEDEMRLKEKELVVLSEMSYNLCEGGRGGFGYINSNPEKFLTEKRLKSLISIEDVWKRWRFRYDTDEVFRKDCAKRAKFASLVAKENNPNGTFFGKNHTEETKNKMKKSKNVGVDNSQYGTCWITNSQQNKKIKKDNLDQWIELGYRKGRI